MPCSDKVDQHPPRLPRWVLGAVLPPLGLSLVIAAMLTRHSLDGGTSLALAGATLVCGAASVRFSRSASR